MKTLANLRTTSFLFLLVMLTSCGSEKLDRDKAADLIKEFYDYPRVEVGKIDVSSKQLRQDGWGYMKGNYGMTYFYFHEPALPYILHPSNKGYDINIDGSRGIEVIANCHNFEEVTGIALDEATKTAKVEFTCHRMGVTPLGELVGRKNGEVVNYSVNMQLYDDGWRITEKAQENIKPETYPYFNAKGEFVGLPDEGV